MAVANALRLFDPTKDTAFASFCRTKVQYALQEERRRQDPAGRTRRAKIRAGELEEGQKISPCSRWKWWWPTVVSRC